jgi:hypothetical protein
MELASADDTAAKERACLILEKEEMPVIHVQHIALLTFTQYRRC